MNHIRMSRKVFYHWKRRKGMSNIPQAMATVPNHTQQEQSVVCVGDSMDEIEGYLKCYISLPHPALAVSELTGESSGSASREEVESSAEILELARGIEPPTCGLQNRCSAIELRQLEQMGVRMSCIARKPNNCINICQAEPRRDWRNPDSIRLAIA